MMRLLPTRKPAEAGLAIVLSGALRWRSAMVLLPKPVRHSLLSNRPIPIFCLQLHRNRNTLLPVTTMSFAAAQVV